MHFTMRGPSNELTTAFVKVEKEWSAVRSNTLRRPTRDRKGDDLALAIRQLFVAAPPAVIENEDLLAGLPLPGEPLAALDDPRTGLDLR